MSEETLFIVENNATEIQRIIDEEIFTFWHIEDLSGQTVEYRNFTFVNAEETKSIPYTSPVTVTYETLPVEEPTAGITGITPSTFSLEYGQNREVDFTITNGNLNPEFIHLIAESSVSEDLAFLVTDNATEIQRIIDEGTFKFWHIEDLTGQTVEYTNFTFVNNDETKSIPYEGPLIVNYAKDIEETEVDPTLAYATDFSPTFITINSSEISYVSFGVVNPANISQVNGMIADLYYTNNNTLMEKDALILETVPAQVVLNNRGDTVIWRPDFAGLTVTYSNFRSLSLNNKVSPAASNSLTVEYLVSDTQNIQSQSMPLFLSGAAITETLNTTNLSSVVDVEKNQTLQNITNNTEATLNISVGLEQINISTKEEVAPVLIVEENQTVQNALVTDDEVNKPATDNTDNTPKEDTLIYSYMRGNLTVDVYETETGIKEVAHGSPIHYIIKTDEKRNSETLYGPDKIPYRTENTKPGRKATQIDYGEENITLGDIAATESEIRKDISVIYEQFDSLYRGKYLEGEKTAVAVYTEHFGPYEDEYNKVYYKDYYSDSKNHRIGWEAKNLDGTIHKFDGTGTEYLNENRRIMMKDDGFAYYMDGEDGHKAKNPDGTLHQFGGDDPNGMEWGQYRNQLEEITSNVESATLKDGTILKVHSMTFNGGIITDKGYYVPANWVKTLNFDGNSYNYTPPTILGDWIMDRIDGKGLFKSQNKMLGEEYIAPTLPEGVIEIPQKSLPLPASEGRLDDSKLSFNSKAEDKNYKLAVINVISAEPFENQTEVKEINDSISEVILPANNSPPVDNTTEMNNSQTSIELLFSDSDAFYYDTNNSITDNLSAIPYQIAIIGDTVGVEYENANTTYCYSEDFLPNYPVEIKIISDNNSVGELNFTEKEVLINPYDMNFLANASTWISAERLFLPGEIKNLELKPTDHFYSFLYLNVKEGEVSIRFKDEEGRIIAERINGEFVFNGPKNLLTINEMGLSREVDVEVLEYQPESIIVNVSSTGESAGVYAKDILSSKGLGWNNVEITYTDIYGNQLQAWANKNKLNYSVESKLDFETAPTPYMIAISSSERDISNMVGSGEFVVVDKRTGLEAIAENSF
ncbi:MAG: hypothetical protein KAJ14_14060, partial [Candidatus Omnitrophica bacterium]|nr:hypothetical protein [Candidatus Omnitrophota bacterium]